MTLTDAFCSSENAKAADARAVVMKDREQRGAALAPPAPSILRKYRNVEIQGFKVTDFQNQPEGSQQPVPKAKPIGAVK